MLDFRKAGIDNFCLLSRVVFVSAHAPLKPHRHRHIIELCYLAKGRQTYQVGDQVYRLSANDVYVTMPNELHDSGESPQEKSILYYLHLSCPKSTTGFLNLPHNEGALLRSRLLNLKSRMFHTSSKLREPLDQIIRYAKNESDLKITAIRACLVEFLVAFLACEENTRQNMPSQRMEQVLQHVQQNTKENVVLEKLARISGLSLSRFKKVFRDEVGLSPRQYIMREKILSARNELALREKSITEIAFEYGFSSSQYFAVVFKKYTTKSPSAV